MSETFTLRHLTRTLIAAGAITAAAAHAGDALTIYSSAEPGAVAPEQYRPGTGVPVPGYALVRHERELPLKSGRNQVRFADVAAQIDPTTVAFESLTDPAGTRVIEQSYQFDLLSTDKLLQKYLDREITVEQGIGKDKESFTGTLASTGGGLILRGADGSARIVAGYSGVKLPSLPGGLISKPTLVWDLYAEKAASHKTRVSYQTGGITWWADYNLIYSEGRDANNCKLDVGAWVSILNQSGGSYTDAKLKLIAGDVQRAPRGRVGPAAAEMRMMAKVAEAAPAGFEEKSFFEYHLYTLGFPTTIPDNSTKQIELFPAAREVECRKALVYLGQPPGFRNYGGPATERGYGVQGNTKVDVYLEFKNTKKNHLGIPLPAGRVRVAKIDDADKSLEFIGEDAIGHTARDESVLIKLGSAFDVVGERRQTDFRVDTSAKWLEETIEIRLRNRKDTHVNVVARETLYRWTNWEITRKSQEFEKKDSRTIEFPVKIAKGGEAVIRYTVRYTW